MSLRLPGLLRATACRHRLTDAAVVSDRRVRPEVSAVGTGDERSGATAMSRGGATRAGGTSSMRRMPPRNGAGESRFVISSGGNAVVAQPRHRRIPRHLLAVRLSGVQTPARRAAASLA